MQLRILEKNLSVVKMSANAMIPDWALRSDLFSITRTDEELSIVCPTGSIMQEESIQAREDGWKAIKVEGILDFSLTGILSSLAGPLAENKVSIFALSTYNTDYLMVKRVDLEKAREVLENEGHEFV